MHKRLVGLLIGVVGVVSLGPAAVGALSGGRHAGVPDGLRATARPAVTTGACKPVKTSYAASDLQGSSTTSTSFVAIPEATVAFNVAGTSPSCVIVIFSAETYAAGGDLVYVRPLLDGGTVAVPSQTQFSGDDDENGDGRWARSHDMNFVFPSVAPGSHSLVMQFASFAGGTVYVHQHTTLVEHR
jgi:hypothetical protein